MRRLFARFAPALALLILAAFACQLEVGYAEQMGWVTCGEHSGDSPVQGDDGDGHCCCHLHPAPVHVSTSVLVEGAPLSGEQSFRLSDLAMPEELFQAIDQPPKIA
ncbi:MAG: hypothetical protein PW734_11170 [Verrucomicrobium sp.]|nr:hypothetical protein [Verrucomicrobium sp.]